MALTQDYFELFGLAPCYRIDAKALEEAFRRVSLQVHPDRFAGASPAMQRVAEQWSARANEAHAVLASPLKRAAYLCERAGAPLEAEKNTRMPVDFLMQQMGWREALESGAGDRSKLETLRGEVADEGRALIEAIGEALDDEKSPQKAVPLVRKLMFIEKMAGEVSAALGKI